MRDSKRENGNNIGITFTGRYNNNNNKFLTFSSSQYFLLSFSLALSLFLLTESLTLSRDPNKLFKLCM